MTIETIYCNDEPCYWEDLLRDNDEDETVVEAIRALLAGAVTEVFLGGGASPEFRLATTPLDRTLPIGATVALPDGEYGRGTVLYEYVMPSHARMDSWRFYSRPGRRVYVCHFPGAGYFQEIACGVDEVEVVP